MAFKYKVESIWDHNPTKAELEKIGIKTDEDIKFSQECSAQATKVSWHRLCLFLYDRGEKEKAWQYYRKAEKDGYDDLFNLKHDLSGGCIQKHLF